jgi:hypothetical protein
MTIRQPFCSGCRDAFTLLDCFVDLDQNSRIHSLEQRRIIEMSGIAGRLFHEFASVLVISMVVSLTITPMMCAVLLKPEHEIQHGRLYNWSERGFAALVEAYRRSLLWVLDHPALVLIAFIAILVLNVSLMTRVQKGRRHTHPLRTQPGLFFNNLRAACNLRSRGHHSDQGAGRSPRRH